MTQNLSQSFKDSMTEKDLLSEELIEETRKKKGRANLRVVREILSQKPDINARDAAAFDDRTALMWSAINGHDDVAALLIDRGADLDMRDGKGNTALLLAVFNKQYDIAIRLLDAGAGLFIENNLRHNALDYIRLSGDAALIAKAEALAVAQNPEGKAGSATKAWARPTL